MTGKRTLRATILMARLAILLLAFIVILKPGETHAEKIDFCKWTTEPGDYLDVKAHKPSYFLYSFGTPDKEHGNTENVIFQFSIKQQLCENIYVSYSQKSIWNYSDEPSPFRKSDFSVEFFYDLKDTDSPLGFFNLGLIGIEHESNGLGGRDSRSWNKVYWEPTLFLIRKTTGVSVHLFTLSARGRLAFVKSGANADISDYYGDADIIMQYKYSRNKAGQTESKDRGLYAVLKMRKGRESDYGAVRLDISIKYLLPVSLRLYFWDGYGESLIDYNIRATRFGIGLTFADGTVF